MSTPQPPKPAKLVIGLFMKNRDLLAPLARRLIDVYGGLDLVSAWIPFSYTDYYEPEMGAPLYRRMLSFRSLISQDALADIKTETNRLESGYIEAGARRVNIDPGYLLQERFVLASGKNFTHRISIGRGIYADLTLIYTKGDFQTLPWTYPDYADPRMIAFLRQVRDRYVHAVK